MRLLATADLHYNHPRSKALAEELIDEMNAAGGDALLLVGDTAVADGDSLERCLERFRFSGPKLFVAGNHELWTLGADSHQLFIEALPARVRAMGWRWLETEPAIFGDVAIVGSVGWYDYAFARADLGIPRRFYADKVSPGAAERFAEYAHLFERQDDIGPEARSIVARWNDGRLVKLGRDDDTFLHERLAQLRASLDAVSHVPTVLAAIHHVPFAGLLPPHRGAQWDFARAFLGSPRLGELVSRFKNVRHLLCGHSHFPVTARIGTVDAVNIGSGYRGKRYVMIDLPSG